MRYRKLICGMLCAVMLLGMAVSAVPPVAHAGSIFGDVEDHASYMPFLQLLRTLHVVSGDPDGNFRPNDGLTRAEFAKLTVHMLDKQDAIGSNAGTSAFKDLSSNHWALSYINYVVKNAYIIGYPDGTFRPDESLTYAQAVTVVLRVLGYSAQEIGDFWPDNYMQKANALGLTAGMYADAGSPISRADMITVLGRALETDMNTGATGGAKTKLINVFGYSIIDETILIATHENNKSYSYDTVRITEGTYKTDTDSVFGLEGQLVKLYLNDEKKIVMALPLPQYRQEMVIEKHLEENTYLCVADGGYMEYDFDDNTYVYYEGATTGTFSTLKSYFEPGATVTLHGKYDGRWDYAVVSKAGKLTPFIAERDVYEGESSINGMDIADAGAVKVYRNGLAAKLSDIRRYDVVYYNRAIKTVEAYSEKMTGIYRAALPNKAHATSITLDNATYEIETRDATAKLDETAGSFKIGDRMTLLLGKDGKVAGAVSFPDSICYNRKVVTFVSDKDVAAGVATINGVAINTDGLSIYRDGLAAKLSDIRRFDVVYYNEYERTMDVYIEKVSGAYKKALPNKAHVTSIELGGKIYEIDNCNATVKLDETPGSYKLDDRITLLLGKDGKIAGVANIENDVSMNYGVIVNTSLETSQEEGSRGETEYYANIFMGDGVTYKYKTDKNYSDHKGRLVKLTFTNGLCTLQKASSPTLEGDLDAAAKRIGTKPLANDVVLFDLVSNPTGQDAQVILIDLADISQSYLYPDDVNSYVSTTGFGDVGVILFNNITASNQKYGIVTGASVKGSDMASTGSYKVLVDSTEYSTAGSTLYGVSVGQPVSITLSGNSISKMVGLRKIASASKLDAIDFDRIKIDGVIYQMDENAVIYKYDGSNLKYLAVSQSALKENNVMSIELYSDKSLSAGGKIKLIKVSYYTK